MIKLVHVLDHTHFQILLVTLHSWRFDVRDAVEELVQLVWRRLGSVDIESRDGWPTFILVLGGGDGLLRICLRALLHQDGCLLHG